MMRAYEVRTAIDNYREPRTVFAASAGKARNEVRANANDAGFNISFKHITVRSLGMRETPRERAEREVVSFNANYPVGTRVRVHPFTTDDEYSYCTTVQPPGAFIAPGGAPCVKVPGDWIAISHVFPIAAEVQPCR